MTDDQQLIDTPESSNASGNTSPIEGRNERREFFRAALGAAAVTAAGASALAIATSASAAVIVDNVLLRYLVQLDYLAGQYFTFATTGVGLPAALLTGQTGEAAGAATGARLVNFTDPVVGQYAAEIASDLKGNITWLRGQLGAEGIVAQPAIDLGTTATGAFSKLAQAAGIVPAATSFDPYLNDGNFLLGAFMFEDVIVTAYINAVPNIADKTILAGISAILATHSHHAAVIRALLYKKGNTTPPTLRNNADAISVVRDNLDGVPGIDDHGISPVTISGNIVSNIVPVAPNGSIVGRASGSVLNELYLNSTSATSGGFFTAGLNGDVKASTAN
ncbi:MAG: ferritin-like domain-containing protein [Sphingomonas sp.]